ncbi:hypothetical protein GCM10017673_31980 [Streptosporangium violaceochromogenes]|nr:hypothetical protein GCM10017673_31980 [Streptosporangium violaceochromogenes]
MELTPSGDGKFNIKLSASEINMILAGMREALEALEDWEFRTRTGFDREEMEAFNNSMHQALKNYR